MSDRGEVSDTDHRRRLHRRRECGDGHSSSRDRRGDEVPLLPTDFRTAIIKHAPPVPQALLRRLQERDHQGIGKVSHLTKVIIFICFKEYCAFGVFSFVLIQYWFVHYFLMIRVDPFL